MDTYAAIPYDSTPFADTHPETLAVRGRLFGLATPDPGRARVLELGCASGGNLIPMAWHLPRGEFLGIELSGPQARAGQALIQELGLGNIRIRQADIMELGAELGEFDYILVHGVYSWVPPPVQARILELCGRHLSPDGVAYVSYNTLPGWRMRGMVRDILLYHTRGFEQPMEKVTRARQLLEEMEPVLAGLPALSTQYLTREVRYLRQAHPSYLYHEYLEAVNEPVLFKDFMTGAEAHGLQFVCEVDLAGMFPSTLGANAEHWAAGFDDLLETEQYLDFIRNRNFRQTLLCRDDRTLTREVDLGSLERYGFCADLTAPRKLDLRRPKEQPFTGPDAQAFQVAHPLTKAALVHLAEIYPDAAPLDRLRGAAQRAVNAAGGTAVALQTDHLDGELFSLFAHRAVALVTDPRPIARAPGARPRAHALARTQVRARLGHLATARHASLRLDPFAARLVEHLDGTGTVPELVERLLEEIQAGTLALPEGPAPRPETLRRQVALNCERLLALFARHGILTGDDGGP